MCASYCLGKIFKIFDLNTQQCYIGSTCSFLLSDKFNGVIEDYKRYILGKRKYSRVFDILGTGNCDIELLEAYSCSNNAQLNARKKYWVKKLPHCINNKKLVAENKNKTPKKINFTETDFNICKSVENLD